MQGLIAFIIRTTLALVVFLYLVVRWAWLPFNNPEMDMEITIVSVFFGTAMPTQWVRDLLLLSRACLGLMVAFYIFMPGLRFFFEFRAEMYNNTLAIILAAVMVASFIGALVVHWMFYI